MLFQLVIILIEVSLWVGIVYLAVLLIRALRKYLSADKPHSETRTVRQSLGEIIREHRTRCGMTQEFVAEQLGVSRQAVSKWENGSSDPSTSNLLALSKLFGVSAEDLLKSIKLD